MICSHSPEQVNDISVYRFKSNVCYGLSQKDEVFYVMDDNKNIHKLVRMQQSEQLRIDDMFVLTARQSAMVQEKTNHLSYDEDMIVHRKYIIQSRKIMFPFKEGTIRHRKIFEPVDIILSVDE